jgi:small subunit ribosomal protein S5
MTDSESTIPMTDTTPTVAAPSAAAPVPPAGDVQDTRRQGGRGGSPDRRGGGGRNPRRSGGRRDDRPRSEYDQKMLSVRRVARVMAGGRRFNFSVALAIGDKKGSVGVGTGKAGDTALAIEKAMRDAKKNLLKLKLTKEMTLPHDVFAKYASSSVAIFPAKGRGLVAGSSVRTVLELAGVKDVTAKILSRSKNQLNNARAAMEALRGLSH